MFSGKGKYKCWMDGRLAGWMDGWIKWLWRSYKTQDLWYNDYLCSASSGGLEHSHQSSLSNLLESNHSLPILYFMSLAFDSGFFLLLQLYVGLPVYPRAFCSSLKQQIGRVARAQALKPDTLRSHRHLSPPVWLWEHFFEWGSKGSKSSFSHL